MPELSMEPLREWFETHVDHYRNEAGEASEMVELKHQHTFRVMTHARAIRKEWGASDEMSFALDAAALLHDVGRFPQVVRRKTYDDMEGYNHAVEGEKILSEAGVLDYLPDHIGEVVLTAVKHHNLGVLPGNLAPDARLVTEAVRDADKMDAIRNILRCLSPDALQGKALKSGMSWDDNEVSPVVFKAAMNRQLVAFEAIKWSNDFILFVCCWLYDLHYNYSYRHLSESGKFETLLSKLPDNGQFAELKEQFRSDLDWIEKRSR
ncbi:HD domain-containing protein [Pseudodesulfovibrio sp. zrk46]|uniref:HD domain-containing protein n=1 Tax=Pseudodesulfovibrio sp. zrk46 TaxID=2725288 RepID=UPI001449E855|nr:HD domain-containing protein [Pseudodesulfovibrio sp. zrk46]QJB56070.1 HD domain-containing protein [Pseudodesulfovibrio sp. zrk46]